MIEASCHCGAIRMEIADKPQRVTSCNCSICRRLGALWAYYHPDQVRFTAGAGITVPYAHGEQCLTLCRCATCGCVTHWQPIGSVRNRMGVNFRNFDPSVIDSTRVRRLDGADTWKFLD